MSQFIARGAGLRTPIVDSRSVIAVTLGHAADRPDRSPDEDHLFKLRFAVADIPEWSAGYSYDGSDTRFLREVRPAVRSRGYLTVAHRDRR